MKRNNTDISERRWDMYETCQNEEWGPIQRVWLGVGGSIGKWAGRVRQSPSRKAVRAGGGASVWGNG